MVAVQVSLEGTWNNSASEGQGSESADHKPQSRKSNLNENQRFYDSHQNHHNQVGLKNLIYIHCLLIGNFVSIPVTSLMCCLGSNNVGLYWPSWQNWLEF